MHNCSITSRAAALVLAVGLAVSVYAASDSAVELAKLPKAVQKTIEQQVGDGKIVKLKKQRAGRAVIYGAECAKGDKKWQVEVAADGTLVARAEELAAAELPAPVQKTVQENTAGDRMESIMKVTEDKQEYYAAAVTATNGQEQTLIVAPDGKLLDTQIPESAARSEPRGESSSAPPTPDEHKPAAKRANQS